MKPDNGNNGPTVRPASDTSFIANSGPARSNTVDTMARKNVRARKLVFDTVVFALAWIPIILLNVIAVPFQRGFFCDDTSIRYPYMPDTVTPLALYAGGAAIVIAIVFFTELTISTTRKQHVRYSIFNKAVHPLVSNLYIYLGFCLVGVILVQTTTDICKVMLGRLRPHFIAACLPNWDRINCKEYVTHAFCTSDDKKKINEARLSFLSGHASYSWYMMTYLAVYLHFRLIKCKYLLTRFLQFLFIAVALCTSLSRISDYKHHWSDVLGGTILGIIVSMITCFTIANIPKRCGLSKRGY